MKLTKGDHSIATHEMATMVVATATTAVSLKTFEKVLFVGVELCNYRYFTPPFAVLPAGQNAIGLLRARREPLKFPYNNRADVRHSYRGF